MMYNNKRSNRNTNDINIKLDFVNKGFRKDGILREELLTSEAKEIAKALYHNGDRKKGVSSSQLRGFFNEVRAIQNRINDSEESFNKNYPFILMLKSKAAYKYRNGLNAKISANFYEFLNSSVDYIKYHKSLQTFNDFVILFETIVGYFYGFGGAR